MANEVHVTLNNSTIHNPGKTADKTGAGVPVVSTGNPKDKNAAVHGQVSGTGVIIHNPDQG